MNILFYGDSITDAGSYGKTNEELTGYSKYVYNGLKRDDIIFYNRGRCGDRSIDLVARYEDDVKSVEPDVMCILIGINDVWRAYGDNMYTDPKDYAKNLSNLIVRTKRDFTYSQLGVLAELVAINSQIPTNRKTLSFNKIKESIEQSIQQGDIDKNLLGSIFRK